MDAREHKDSALAPCGGEAQACPLSMSHTITPAIGAEHSDKIAASGAAARHSLIARP